MVHSNIVDKIYCINLDRRPDRWAQASEEFKKHGLQVERFAAIDGDDFRIKYESDLGNAGCTLSHYFLIERAKLMGMEAIMIFEDDAVLHPDFNSLLEGCILELPIDWDMLYFGGSHREKPTDYKSNLMRLHKTFTTHGYIIRSSMFDKVINSFKHLDQPVDCYYALWQKEHNVFITNPPICWQRGGYSDICKREMHYSWIKSNIQ